MTQVRLLILSCLLLAGTALADNETRLREIGNASNLRLAIADDSGAGSKVYIVQLRTPSAAEQFSSFNTAFASKSMDAPPASFDKHNSAVQSYTAELGALQDKVLSQAGSNIERIYSYRYTLNGFAARMTEAQAHKLEHLDEVLTVWEDEIRPLATNYSPQFLGLFEPTVGLRGAPGLDGDGVIVAVIDSGITPEHPALKDTREADRPSFCQSSTAPRSVPKIDALTRLPAAVVAVWVPWPSVSRAEKISPLSMGPVACAPATKYRAPINLLLHAVSSNCTPD